MCPSSRPFHILALAPLHAHVLIAATFMCDSTPRLRWPLLYNLHLLPPYIGYTVYRAHHAPSTSLQVSLLPHITQPDIRSQSHTSTMRWRICASHLNFAIQNSTNCASHLDHTSAQEGFLLEMPTFIAVNKFVCPSGQMWEYEC